MWLVGGIYGYGYNVWVWLVGVVMRYIDILIIIINFTYSTCIRFWQQHPYFFVHFLNVFSVLFPLFFYNV